MRKALVYLLMLIVPPLVIVPVLFPMLINGLNGKGYYHGPGILLVLALFLGISIVINAIIVLLLERKVPAGEKVLDIGLGILFSFAGTVIGCILYLAIAFFLLGHNAMESAEPMFL